MARIKDSSGWHSRAALPLLVALVIIALAFAVISTITLWRIADKTEGSNEKGPPNGPVANIPPLPEEQHRGTSSKELLGEVDKLSSPLNRLNGQLAPLSGAARGLSALPASISQSTSMFKRVSSNLNSLTEQSKGLAFPQRPLKRVANSIDSLKSIIAPMKNMNKKISALNDVASKTDAVNASIERMSQKLDYTNGKLQLLDTTNASLGSMTKYLEQVNILVQRTSAILDFMCDKFRKERWRENHPEICP